MILCHGETLIDFIPTQARDGSPAYRAANGGSPGNVALALGRLEVPVGFVGGLSDDFFGDAIARGLQDNGVSLAYASRSHRPTMLAFVNLEGEEPRYAFFDAESAPRHWDLADLPELGPEVKALHFGSLSLIRKPAADAFFELLQREAARRVISFDPNIRPSLVDDEAEYRGRLDAIFRRAHVIKASRADLDWIAPGQDPEEWAAGCLAAQARLVLVTQGGAGAVAYSRAGRVARPALPIEVADTVGAGDSFMAGVLAALHDRQLLKRTAMKDFPPADLQEILDFALAVSAVTCSRIGADPPRRDELAHYLP